VIYAFQIPIIAIIAEVALPELIRFLFKKNEIGYYKVFIYL
jgi:hypothetical protein